MGILLKVEFSEWAAPTVYIRKKSKEIRVCADFSTGLNAALKDYHYSLPSLEEVFNELNGGKVFSKIDLGEAYLQIPIEENSSKLLCINTHRGLYKFDRLVFGIKVAPAFFQQVMDTMLGGFDFTLSYLDDIVISSKTKELHREHLNKVFAQIREFGFKVKEAKCDFCMNKIKYLGHIIDKDERRAEPERATAIKDMLAPDNVTTLQSFLGLADYYKSFIKNLHDLCTPLNELLKKDKKWRWTPECQTAFDQIKKALPSDLFLTHYDPKLEIIVASDASSYGVGSCILHKMPDGTKKPIAHASRTLLLAEKHYSQIEKEALGIKFHRYLHGRFFTLQTDHKPLITIFGSKKGLPIYTANRLRRWGTNLLNFNFKIEYLPSKQISHADGLLMLVPKFSEPFEDTIIAALRTDCEIKNMIANTIKELPVTQLEIKSEAMNDDFITNIKQKITAKKRKSIRSIFTMGQRPPI